MPLTNFVSRVTIITAAWANKVDKLLVTVFGEAETKADARVALHPTPTDGNILVGDGTDWVNESGATARTSLGAVGSADLASNANALGASLVGIEDTAGNFGATNVEAALAEIYTDFSSSSSGLGASLVGFNPAGNIASTNVQNALSELDSEKVPETDFSAYGKTLVDDADAATARTTLGLGTSATQNVGVTTGDVVQVDTGNKLPVIDGSQLTNISVSNVPSSTVRQSVLSGKTDSDGLANFVEAGSGLNADINTTAGSDPVILNFADGFDTTNGKQDYIGSISSDQAAYFGTFPANSENYLYVNRNSGTGVLTGGHVSNLPPICGPSYLSAEGVGTLYSSFDGADAATAFTDASGMAWTFAANAQLDTAQKKFGTASLYLDGIGDYVQVASDFVFHAGENKGGFEFIFWYRPEVSGVSDNILGNTTNNHLALTKNASDILALSLGNGSTWTIASAVAGTTVLAINTWYRIRIVWDGAAYKLYLSNNGGIEVEEISVTSAVAFARTRGEFCIGQNNSSSHAQGWFDDVSYCIGPQTIGIKTPEATARGGLAENNEHWFDTSIMKMKYWDRSTASWTETQRVFVGEAITDASTVTTATTYALRGEYTSIFTISVNTLYTKSHNLGCVPDQVQAYIREHKGYNWIPAMYSGMLNAASASDRGGLTVGCNRSQVLAFTDNYTIISNLLNMDDVNGGQDTAQVDFADLKIIVKRGW